MKATISIIVPIYNVEKYLVQCIDSILNQTYKEIQVILVDDGSTDSSGTICDEYQKKDNRIVVIHQENKGAVAARRAGLREAVGEYIGFVDSDDYIEPQMYVRLLAIMESMEADIVHSGFFKNSNIAIWGTTDTTSYDMNENNINKILQMVLAPEKMDASISASMWSKLYKREIIMQAYKEVPDFQAYGEDLLCFCNAIFACKRISIINEAYYHYIFREDSIVHKLKKDIITREYSLYEQLLLVLEKYTESECLREYADRLLLHNLSFALKRVNATGIRCYEYPELRDVRNKNIVIYGAGAVGQDYYMQFSIEERCNIVAWIDAAYELYALDYYWVQPVEVIKQIHYDIIVIAVSNRNLADEVAKTLEKMGIQRNKMLWKVPVYAMNLRS